MPSLIDIRRRIRSVKNTQQITKAMKMVSAAKLRRAQDRVIASRPFGALLRKVLANVAAAVSGDENAGKNRLLARRPEKNVLLVLISGDKGLAGAACFLREPGRIVHRPRSALAMKDDWLARVQCEVGLVQLG